MDDLHEPLRVDTRNVTDSWSPPPALSELDLIRTRVPIGGSATAIPVEPPKSVLKRLVALPAAEPAPGGAAPPPEEDADDERYAIKDEIGRGGMGRVLLARDHDLNRDVAMKVLLHKEVSDAQLRRFIEEAQVTGQLEHPNVLPVHDFGVNGDGDLFFTMKLVKGHVTLEEVIERLRGGDREAFRLFTFERRVQLIQHVCHALTYAHQRGVVHRDLKPSNVVLGTCGEVFLVDWGVAKLAGDSPRGPAPASVRAPDVVRPSDRLGRKATRDGEWLGTPAYMAPEQVVGHQHEIDARTDVYSLVAVMYELLTLHYYLGTVGGRSGDIMAAILGRRPHDAEDHKHPVQGRVPRILSRICRKGLEKRQEDRFQSAAELERELQAWLEGNTPIVCPGTAIKRGLTGWSLLIDRYPVLVPAASITALVLMLAALVTSVWLLARGV